MATVHDFYRLSKPGIVYGNVLHAVAGSLFAIAAYGHGWQLLVWNAIGVALVIASACVVNNVGDVSLDIHMARTRSRPSVTGVVPRNIAILYAILLAIGGFGVLLIGVNLLVFWLGVISYFRYTVIYAYAKRQSPLGTLVGTVPGALPIVAGYVAVSGTFDAAAIGLGLMLVAWQMVHFYAIAIFRKDEYRKAGVPVISAKKTFHQIKRSMLAWTAVYIVIIVGLTAARSTPIVPSIILLIGAFYWLGVIARPVQPDATWARKVFGVSLLLSIVMLVTGAIAIVVA